MGELYKHRAMHSLYMECSPLVMACYFLLSGYNVVMNLRPQP